MTAIHQYVPMLHRGDAVGKHALALQEGLRGVGVTSEIVVELEDPETANLTRLVAEFTPDPDDVLVYQFATASDLAPHIAASGHRLVVNYHNITPPQAFAPWDNELARHQVRAHFELGALAEKALLGVAVSEWNRTDLVAAGFLATAVIPPILVDLGSAGLSRPSHRPAPSGSGPHHWLAVGRLAPNKSVEDAIAAVLASRMIGRPVVLEVVGKPAVPAYAEALHAFADELGVADAVRFLGKVNDEELARAYGEADLLLVVSDHEGFCLPAVEAMARGLPVLAYDEGALSEVLGDAGVLLSSKDPVSIASAANELMMNAARRDEVVSKGRARVAALDLDTAAARLVDLLCAVHQGAGTPDAPYPPGMAVAVRPQEPGPMAVAT